MSLSSWLALATVLAAGGLVGLWAWLGASAVIVALSVSVAGGTGMGLLVVWKVGQRYCHKELTRGHRSV